MLMDDDVNIVYNIASSAVAVQVNVGIAVSAPYVAYTVLADLCCSVV